MTIKLDNKYILPSPAGAYYCIASNEVDSAKSFLQQLMYSNVSLHLDTHNLEQLLKGSNIDQEKILLHIQNLKWLQGFDQEQSIIQGTIEDILPDILKVLSSNGKTLLADQQGFHLAGAGFTHEAAEELAALSADLLSLYSRHQGIIKGNLNIKTSAFSLVDATGYSQLGFWPLYIGETVFILVISGVPRFDQVAFVNLIWILHKRYFVHNS
jgi:hypothetical protein